MNVVITGTSGFIGSRLLRAARSAYGSKVTAFSSRPAEGRHIIYVESAAEFGLGPEQFDLVREADVLVHAGAFTPKTSADANHRAGCTSNITFTHRLLDLPWRNLTKIIFLSSIDVYGTVDGPITESAATTPCSLYGLSKLYGERMVSRFAAELGIASQVLRIGHVYGPGEDRYQKVIPQAIRNIVSGKDVERWGEGQERRSFIYVEDVVSAVLAAVELQDRPGVINVVGGKAIAMRDLLDNLASMGGTGARIVQRQTHEAVRDVVFDNAKMRQYLLANETDFTTGLEAEFRHAQQRLLGGQ